MFGEILSPGTDRLNSFVLGHCHRTRHLRHQVIVSFGSNDSALLLVFRQTFKECRSKANRGFPFLFRNGLWAYSIIGHCNSFHHFASIKSSDRGRITFFPRNCPTASITQYWIPFSWAMYWEWKLSLRWLHISSGISLIQRSNREVEIT